MRPSRAIFAALAALTLLAPPAALAADPVQARKDLKAMGVEPGLAGCALRVSLGWNTTEAEVKGFLDGFENVGFEAKGVKWHNDNDLDLLLFPRLFPTIGFQIITEPGSLVDLPCL